mgnify:CR=1 FL=1
MMRSVVSRMRTNRSGVIVPPTDGTMCSVAPNAFMWFRFSIENASDVTSCIG